MKKLFFAMLALVALASCSKDEVVQLNQDEIKFSVVAENATKATDVYCNNNLFDKFNVIASYTDDAGTKTYIDKDEIENKSNVWTNNTATRFWPSAENCLDFYAYANAGIASVSEGVTTENAVNAVTTPQNWTNQTTPTVLFNSNKKEVRQHVDFVYAVTTDQDKANEDVKLNFRHALSQIVFKAKNNNPKLHMVVTGVEIHNVNSQGTFTFPSSSTTSAYVDHGTPVNNPEETIDVQGTWTDLSIPEDYVVKQLDAAVKGDGNIVNLTDITSFTDEETSTTTYNYDCSMLLIPQSGEEWALAPNTQYTDDATTGVFFVLMCRIYNVAGDTYDNTTDVMLHGTIDDNNEHQPAPIYLPLQGFEWNQGKKYTYTFVLDKGDITGGDDEGGNDILTSINYTVTVDDFKYGGESDVEMDDVE